jgi:hypothetical protein
MSFSPKAVTAMAVITWGAAGVATITAGAEAAAITMAGGEDTDGIGIDPRRFQRPPFGGLCLRYVYYVIEIVLLPALLRVAMQSERPLTFSFALSVVG